MILIRSLSFCSAASTVAGSYRNDIPYCDTESNPDFQTSVTSHAFVACSLHERKAETAFPPTIELDVSLLLLVQHLPHQAAECGREGGWSDEGDGDMFMAPASKYSPDKILNLGGDGAIISFELSSAAPPVKRRRQSRLSIRKKSVPIVQISPGIAPSSDCSSRVTHLHPAEIAPDR